MEAENKRDRSRYHNTINLGILPPELREQIRKHGAIQDGVNLYCPPRRPRYMDSFQTTSDFTHQYLALEPGLKGNTFRVFHYLCYILQYDNWIDISTVWIAEKLGINRPEVSNALSTLEKKGLLIRGEKIGRHYKWRLNPEATWKGTAKARWETIEEIPYSNFIEQKIQYGNEHGFPLGYLRGLRPIEGGKKKKPISKEQLEQENEYNRIIRTKLYGKEYTDGIDWDNLSEAEVARLHIRAAKAKFEMKESGEWDKLSKKYFLPKEKTKAQVIEVTEKAKQKKKVQDLVEKIMSSNIDLDQLEKFLKKNENKGS